MKKLSLIVLLLLSISAYAQNNIVYVRYDMAQGDASLVVSKIDEIISRTRGEFVIYYSNGQTPIICDDYDKWPQLKTDILSQQTSPDYYLEEDFAGLNKLFGEKLKETVSTGSPMSISGKNDNEWSCTFILSRQMLESDDESDFVVRIISVNELLVRMPVKVWSYDNDNISAIRIDELGNNNLFNYNIDK